MSAAAEQTAVAERPVDIIEAVAANPGVVLLDKQSFDTFVAKLREDAPKDVDVTTRKGRDLLKGYAAKIRSHRSSVNNERLRVTAEWRRMTSEANAAGKVIDEELDQLAIEIRKPLTDWEEAEKARETTVTEWFKTFASARFVAMDETSKTVGERGYQIGEMIVTKEVFGDRFDEAVKERQDTLDHLMTAMKRLQDQEAKDAELEKLRKDAADREREADEQKRKQEEAEAAQREADQRAEQAKADQERIDREREDAAQKALADAEAKRRYASQIIDQIRAVGQGKIDGKPYGYDTLIHHLEVSVVIDDKLGDQQEAVRSVRDATLDLLKAAQDRANEAAAEKARQEQVEADQRRAEEEQRKRAENQEHRRKIKAAAKEAIMECGASEEIAVAIVTKIVAREIPNVSMEF